MSSLRRGRDSAEWPARAVKLIGVDAGGGLPRGTCMCKDGVEAEVAGRLCKRTECDVVVLVSEREVSGTAVASDMATTTSILPQVGAASPLETPRTAASPDGTLLLRGASLRGWPDILVGQHKLPAASTVTLLPRLLGASTTIALPVA